MPILNLSGENIRLFARNKHSVLFHVNQHHSWIKYSIDDATDSTKPMQ